MSSIDKVIEVEGLTKDFSTDFWKPKVRAIEDVKFHVREGGIFGLIGPNGAGKTTIIKTILGLIRPTHGTVRIYGSGLEDRRSRQMLGYLPENAYYYDYLRAGEVLDFYCRLFGLGRRARRSKVDELLELVGLQDKKNIRLRGFSKGMLQRIGIAQALVNDPKLIILDEPMSGLDPIGRKEVRDIILELHGRGKTILFSSHILSDVEAICEDVAILVKGHLKAFGSLKELVNAEIRSSEVTLSGPTLPEVSNRWGDDVAERKVGAHLVLTVKDISRLQEVLDWGQSAGLKPVSIVPQKDSLEDLFLEKVEAVG
jgi:ABC-2 type transport system ATP-binding protein